MNIIYSKLRTVLMLPVINGKGKNSRQISIIYLPTKKARPAFSDMSLTRDVAMVFSKRVTIKKLPVNMS